MWSLLDSPIFKVCALVAVLFALAIIGFANLGLEKTVISAILITGYYIIFIPSSISDGSMGGAIAIYFGILVAIYLIAIIVTAIQKNKFEAKILDPAPALLKRNGYLFVFYSAVRTSMRVLRIALYFFVHV